MMAPAPVSEHIKLHLIGNERRPVLVIEDFLTDPSAIADEASGAVFQPFVRFFPGVQAPFAFDRMIDLCAPYAKIIGETFRLTNPSSLIECGLALVTTPAAALAPLQRIPHVDTTDPDRIAVLAYVSGPQFGGTAFYRHKSTNFEYLDDRRIAKYNQSLDRDIAQRGVPEPGYISGDTEIFDLIAKFDANPGRAIIYASNSLHSGWIQNADRLSTDVSRGRLTLNAFFGSRQS